MIADRKFEPKNKKKKKKKKRKKKKRKKRARKDQRLTNLASMEEEGRRRWIGRQERKCTYWPASACSY